MVEGGFEFTNGGEVAVAAAEGFDDFDGGAQGAEGVDLEDIEGFEGGDAGVGVFLEEGIEDGAGFGTVLGEDVAFPHAFGPFLAGEGRGVEGDVAHLLGQFIQEDAFGGEFLEDGLFAVGIVPGGEEVIEGGVGFAQGFAGVIAQGFGDEAAIFVEVLDTLGGDGDFHVVDVVFGAAGGGIGARTGPRPGGRFSA